MTSLKCGIESRKQQTSKQKFTDTHNTMVVTRGEKNEGGKECQIHGKGRRLDLGW